MGKPLTLEEVKALEVEDWVWIDYLTLPKEHNEYVLKSSQSTDSRLYDILDANEYGEETYLTYDSYGESWLAYRNRESAECKGTITELPCAVGDTMWLLYDPLYVADICEVVIEEINISRNGITVSCVYGDEYCNFNADFIFNTREQAQAKLEELRGEHK